LFFYLRPVSIGLTLVGLLYNAVLWGVYTIQQTSSNRNAGRLLDRVNTRN